MSTKEFVASLYSDDDYSKFICESAELVVRELITEEEFVERIRAVNEQIKNQ